MHIHRFSARARLAVLVMAGLAPALVASSALSAEKTGGAIPGEILTAKDTHSAAALKHAEEAENLKKIINQPPKTEPAHEEPHPAQKPKAPKATTKTTPKTITEGAQHKAAATPAAAHGSTKTPTVAQPTAAKSNHSAAKTAAAVAAPAASTASKNKKPALKKAAATQAAPKVEAPVEAAHKEVAHKEVAPADTVDKEAASSEAAHEEAAPVEVVHKAAVPFETTHKAAAPVEAAPPAVVPATEGVSTQAAPAAPVEVATIEKTTTLQPSAEQSLHWLTNGNIRYVKNRFRADGKHQADRTRTSTVQKPHAIVLACSDSRVPPELIFDQALGEISVVRVAGHALDNSVIASLEQAVAKLGPQLIVVLGHTRCEAVDAAVTLKEGESSGSTAFDKVIADIRPRLKTLISEKPSTNLEVESALNADGVARELVDRSEILRKKVEAGDLTIKSALYWVDSGEVKFY